VQYHPGIGQNSTLTENELIFLLSTFCALSTFSPPISLFLGGEAGFPNQSESHYKISFLLDPV